MNPSSGLQREGVHVFNVTHFEKGLENEDTPKSKTYKIGRSGVNLEQEILLVCTEIHVERARARRGEKADSRHCGKRIRIRESDGTDNLETH